MADQEKSPASSPTSGNSSESKFTWKFVAPDTPAEPLDEVISGFRTRIEESRQRSVEQMQKLAEVQASVSHKNSDVMTEEDNRAFEQMRTDIALQKVRDRLERVMRNPVKKIEHLVAPGLSEQTKLQREMDFLAEQTRDLKRSEAIAQAKKAEAVKEEKRRAALVESTTPTVSDEFLARALSKPKVSQVDDIIANMHKHRDEQERKAAINPRRDIDNSTTIATGTPRNLRHVGEISLPHQGELSADAHFVRKAEKKKKDLSVEDEAEHADAYAAKYADYDKEIFRVKVDNSYADIETNKGILYVENGNVLIEQADEHGYVWARKGSTVHIENNDGVADLSDDAELFLEHQSSNGSVHLFSDKNRVFLLGTEKGTTHESIKSPSANQVHFNTPLSEKIHYLELDSLPSPADIFDRKPAEEFLKKASIYNRDGRQMVAIRAHSESGKSDSQAFFVRRKEIIEGKTVDRLIFYGSCPAGKRAEAEMMYTLLDRLKAQETPRRGEKLAKANQKVVVPESVPKVEVIPDQLDEEPVPEQTGDINSDNGSERADEPAVTNQESTEVIITDSGENPVDEGNTGLNPEDEEDWQAYFKQIRETPFTFAKPTQNDLKNKKDPGAPYPESYATISGADIKRLKSPSQDRSPIPEENFLTQQTEQITDVANDTNKKHSQEAAQEMRVTGESDNQKFGKSPEGFWHSAEADKFGFKIEGETLFIKDGEAVIEISLSDLSRGEISNNLSILGLKKKIHNKGDYQRIIGLLEEARESIGEFQVIIPPPFTDEQMNQMEEEDRPIIEALTQKPERPAWVNHSSDIKKIAGENGTVVSLRDKMRTIKVGSDPRIQVTNEGLEHMDIYDIDGNTVAVDNGMILTGKVSTTFRGDVHFQEGIRASAQKVTLVGRRMEEEESSRLEPEFRLINGVFPGTIEAYGGHISIRNGSKVEKGINGSSKAKVIIDGSKINPRGGQAISINGQETLLSIHNSEVNGRIIITEGGSGIIYGNSKIEGSEFISVGHDFMNTGEESHLRIKGTVIQLADRSFQQSTPEIKVPIIVDSRGVLSIEGSCLNNRVLQDSISFNTAFYSTNLSCLRIVENNSEYIYSTNDFQDKAVFDNGDDLSAWHEEQKRRGKQPMQ